MAVILAARMAFASTIPVVTSYLSSTQIDNLTYDGVLKAKKVSVISSTATPLNVTIVSPTTYPLPTAQVSDLKSVSLSTSLPSGTNLIGNVNAWQAGGWSVTAADERYTSKVSSGTAGKITGATSSSISVSDNVVKYTFKYRNDADASQYATISTDKMGGSVFLADGDVVSVEVVVPAPINFAINSLSAGATLQYVITTLK